MDKELRKVSHGKNSYWVKKINFYQFSTSFPFDAQQRGYSEKAMAPHSSTLAWKIPWIEEPGRLQSMGSLRVRHD